MIHPQFRKCHWHACHTLLNREYGCELSDQGCYTPYQTSLLQTREPWKIVQSLVAKYCWRDDEKTIGVEPPQTLRWLLHAMGLVDMVQNNNDHCVLQMMDYVVGYYNTILDAAPDIAVYAVETTIPCQVAKLAGLWDPATTVYAPNYEKIQTQCEDTTMQSQTTPSSNVINRGRVSIQDLMPFTTQESRDQMKLLYSRLGYDYGED